MESAGFLEDLYSRRSLIQDQIRIVLIGKTGSGKSATGNTLTGKSSFVSELSAASITDVCSSAICKRFGRNIQVVDTPGLFDTRASQEEIVREIKQCVLMTSPGIHALILVNKIGRFTEEEQKTLERFKDIFGDGVGKYLMIVFTGKDNLDAEETTLENFVRSAPPGLQKLVAESNYRYVAVNNRGSREEREMFAKSLLTDIDKMVARNGGKCYTTFMFKQAEVMVKKREEKARKRLEEEKRKQRKNIESAVRKRFEPVMRAQENRMRYVSQAYEDTARQLDDNRHKQSLAVQSLQAQLERSRISMRQEQMDREIHEEKMLKEMQEREERRDRRMHRAMRKMEEERRQDEYEMQEKLKRMERRLTGATWNCESDDDADEGDDSDMLLISYRFGALRLTFSPRNKVNL